MGYHILYPFGRIPDFVMPKGERQAMPLSCNFGLYAQERRIDVSAMLNYNMAMTPARAAAAAPPATTLRSAPDDPVVEAAAVPEA